VLSRAVPTHGGTGSAPFAARWQRAGAGADGSDGSRESNCCRKLNSNAFPNWPMWPKRKAKNRRFEREHILDVKEESRQLRALRFRLAARIFARIFGAFTVVFLLWRGGIWVLDEFVFHNPAFAIQH